MMAWYPSRGHYFKLNKRKWNRHSSRWNQGHSPITQYRLLGSKCFYVSWKFILFNTVYLRFWHVLSSYIHHELFIGCNFSLSSHCLARTLLSHPICELYIYDVEIDICANQVCLSLPNDLAQVLGYLDICSMNWAHILYIKATSLSHILGYDSSQFNWQKPVSSFWMKNLAKLKPCRRYFAFLSPLTFESMLVNYSAVSPTNGQIRDWKKNVIWPLTLQFKRIFLIITYMLSDVLPAYHNVSICYWSQTPNHASRCYIELVLNQSSIIVTFQNLKRKYEFQYLTVIFKTGSFCRITYTLGTSLEYRS